MRVRRSREVAAGRDAIWRVAADPYHLPRWWPRAQRVEAVGPSGWTLVLGTDRGRGVRADYTLLEETPGSRRVWALEVEGTPFERIFSEQVTTLDVADGRVAIEISQKPRRFARFGGWMMRRGTARNVDAALDALAERELEGARNAAIAARAQRDDAQSRLASAKKAMDDTVVRSPLDGIVARRHVSAGDVVSPGRELYTIIDPSSMRLEASVASEQIAQIRVGAPVAFEIRGYPGQTFEGRIERISPMADPVTRQVPIFVGIPNAGGRLVAGLFAEGRVLREVKRALVVPATAVNEPRSGAPWVLRVRDGRAERVEVSLGLRDPQTERVELTWGVAEGDVLLVGAAQGMTPGTPVKVRQSARQAGE